MRALGPSLSLLSSSGSTSSCSVPPAVLLCFQEAIYAAEDASNNGLVAVAGNRLIQAVPPLHVRLVQRKSSWDWIVPVGFEGAQDKGIPPIPSGLVCISGRLADGVQ